MNIINTTPHSITFVSKEGHEFIVPPCGILINAKPFEEPTASRFPDIELVRTAFHPDPSSLLALADLEKENPEAIIVGSIIAAQAFPGRVFGLIAAPGFERVPVDQKKMRSDKFTTF